jgi:hypothetical protein
MTQQQVFISCKISPGILAVLEYFALQTILLLDGTPLFRNLRAVS